MAQTDIGSTDYSDMSNTVSSYTVDSETTDGATESKETTWVNQDWSKQFGYYKHIPELKAAIDAKATWTVGKGYTANANVMARAGLIEGIGIDTFNTILENMIRIPYIY